MTPERLQQIRKLAMHATDWKLEQWAAVADLSAANDMLQQKLTQAEQFARERVCVCASCEAVRKANQNEP